MMHRKSHLFVVLTLLFGLLFLVIPTPGMAQAPSMEMAQTGPITTPLPSLPENVAGRTALTMFDYSLGTNNGNNCFSCTFIQQFLVALASFSAAVFMYFRAFFITLLPILMSLWVAWNVGKLMVYGGADGRTFIMNVVKKSTLFLFLWLVMVLPADNPSRDPSVTMNILEPEDPWTWFGPTALEFGFDLGIEVRTITGQSLLVENANNIDVVQTISMNCTDVGNLNPQLAANRDTLGFAHSASEVTCAFERIHIVGMAAGLAMIEGAWSQIEFNASRNYSEAFGLFGFFSSLFNAIFLTMVGLGMLVVFALSVIWFIFLVLDIVVKVLIIAAISPLLLFLALIAPMRRFAWTAVKGVVGALTTALGLAIIASLAFFLIVNLGNVYNIAIQSYGNNLIPLDGGGNPILQLREFIARMQIDNTSDPRLIPMNLTTPWLYYLVLVSLAIYALGKKVISMIEQIVGAAALSEMADNAKQLAMMGSKTGIAAGAVTGFLGYQGLKAGLKVGSMGGGAAMQGIKTGAGAVANRFKEGNPFGNFVRNSVVNTAQTAGRAGAFTNAATRGAGGVMNDLDEPPSQQR